MEIKKIKTKNEYKKLVAWFYKDDPFFVDNKRALIDLICNKNSCFYSISKQEMVGVFRENKPACVCVLIHHKNDPDSLKMAFFECSKDSFEEVSFLVNYAAGLGAKLGCKKIIASLDGHCNNSVGFLCEGDGKPSFGQSYNPVFYNDFFRRLCFDEIKLLMFKGDISGLNVKLFDFARRKMPSGIVISPADFGFFRFRRTMKVYTDINNKIFKGHRYCFYREHEEDYELFASMRLLLDGDNMIFAKKNDKIAGFLFWYPDFNEIVPPGGHAGLMTFLKYRLLRVTPKTVKAVQIGVLPEFENSGLILALFGEFYRLAMKKHKGLTVCLSSWILEENQKSVKLSSKILPCLNKKISAYEKTI
jgi:hypothetical protein